jgi:hypothetical protein
MLRVRIALAAFAASLLWAPEVFAGLLGGRPAPPPAPEIDGPAGLSAVALLISVGAIVYRKFKG